MESPEAQSRPGGSKAPPFDSQAPAGPPPIPLGNQRSGFTRSNLSVRRAKTPIGFLFRSSGLEPTLRLLGLIAVATGGRILVGLKGLLFISPEGRQESRHEWEVRTVNRTVQILGDLKGVFVKAGQFLALRHDLMPAETAMGFTALRDRVPPLPLAALQPLLLAEWSAEAQAQIAEIEEVPLGAASLAQAHRGHLQDGSEVVIKIQYPWIAEATARDLTVIRAFGRMASWFFRKRLAAIDFDRLFDEFSEGLVDELDFRKEARAAQAIASNLASIQGVAVPSIYNELTTERVLTMSYHPCVPIHDRAALQALGVRPADLLQILAHAYAKQVFVDGLFHADPHPGNLFVLQTPEVRESPRILFVDFGLCRSLSSDLKQAMRAGIYAVLQRNEEEFVARMNEMGMIAPGAEPGVRQAIHAMFERMKAAGESGNLLGASSGGVLALKDEAKRLLQDTPGLQLPNDLLLYAKTLSYVFALGESMDPDVDLMKISLPYLLKFLATPT